MAVFCLLNSHSQASASRAFVLADDSLYSKTLFKHTHKHTNIPIDALNCTNAHKR